MRTIRRNPLSIAFLLLAHLGCDQSPSIVQLGLPGGRIEGFVRSGEISTDMLILATRVDGLPNNELLVKADVASDGSYGIDVPAGRYVIGLGTKYGRIDYEYSDSGPVYGNVPPDTLLVDEQHSHSAVDFNLASMRVQLDVSANLDGEYGSVRLFLRDGFEAARWIRSYQRTGSAQILDGTLSVELTALVPGHYKVQVVLGTSRWDGEYLWMPGVRDSAETTWTAVRADETADVSGQLDAQPARIQGEILGAWRDMRLRVPSLAMVTPDSQVVRGFRDTDSEGRFDEEIYLPEPVKLAVKQDGVVQWIGGNTFETAQVFDMSPGSVTSGIEFTQSGIVIELQGLYGSIGLGYVSLYDATDMTLAAHWRSLTSASGATLRIGNVKPGSYLLFLEQSLPGWYPWVSQWYNQAYDTSNATPVTIGSAGEVVQVAVTLERGGTISGTVLDPQLFEDGYSFFVTSANDQQQWGSQRTRESMGAFTIEGLPDGDWKIGVFRGIGFPDVAPENTIWFPGVSDWSSAGVVTTSGFGDITGIEIVLPASR